MSKSQGIRPSDIRPPLAAANLPSTLLYTSITEGANAVMGIATLSGGTITVGNTRITANTRIFLSVNGAGVLANLGVVYEDTASRVVGTSFVIKSANILSNASVAWLLLEPA